MTKLQEELVFDSITDSLMRMTEEQQYETLQRLDEAALIGSLKSQVKKMTKQVLGTSKSVRKVIDEMGEDIQSNPAKKELYDKLMKVLDNVTEVENALTDENFTQQLKAIDDNTTWTGKTKDSNILSSSNVNDHVKSQKAAQPKAEKPKFSMPKVGIKDIGKMAKNMAKGMVSTKKFDDLSQNKFSKDYKG